MTRCLFRWSLVLLGLVVCWRAEAQVDLPPGTLTPEILQSLCAQQAGPECTVGFAASHTLSLREDWHVPKTIHLRFAAGASLRVTGGVLQFDGGQVGAPADETLFPDPDHIRGLAFARPEWFGAASPGAPVPATALAAAYEATVPWGTIYLQARQYLSPFSACPATPLRFLSPRTFVGSGRPEPDDPENPSRLQGGTVLLGSIAGTAPLRLAHLGIDAGPAAADGVLHGCRPSAIFIEQPQNRQFVSGDRLEDVSVLTTGAKDMHSVMIAGHRDTSVRGLRLWTLGGTHGLVLKSENSVVDGFYCRGSLSDCLIVKSDYATDFLGRAIHDRVAHVDIGPLKPGGVAGGIMVESRWDTVRDLEMTDIQETASLYGIVLLGSSFYHPRDIVIRNWTVDGVTAACLLSDRAVNITVSGFRCSMMPAAKAGALLLGGRNLRLEHSIFRCQGDPAACAAAKMDGVSDDSNGLTLSDVTAEGLGGYLLRSTEPLPDLQSFHVTGMANRLYTHSRVPVRVRLLTFLGQVKPDLRILYTAAAARLQYQPGRYAVAATVALLLVIGAVRTFRGARRRLFAQTK